MVISTVELFGYIAGGLLFESFKVKPSTKLYLISYTVGLVASLGIVFNDPEENEVLDMLLNFLCKFCVAMGFQGVYLSNYLFPIVFSSTTFGLCCMMGSTAAFISIWSIYDFADNQPWLIFIAFSILGIILALLQKE
jgi:hypothetical protein